MSYVTVVWSMIAAACLTLASVHVLVGARQHPGWANLWFALAAVSLAVIALCELLMMHAVTVVQFTGLQRWVHVPLFLLVVGIVWFVRSYFGVGRQWLAWAVIALRLLVLVINFSSATSINYIEIAALRPFELLTETVSVADGVPNPWSRLGEVSGLLTMVFVLDAAATLWRRNADRDRRRAVVIGGSVAISILLSVSNAFLLHTGLMHAPYLLSPAFMVVVAAMSYELSYDLVHASKLARDLRESQQRLDHAGRVTMLGQLVATLAHELNQPLGAILRNTEAAELLMDSGAADPTEIREILADIRRDDQRAGAVIGRLRALLKRRDLDLQSLDLATIVEEVVAVIRSEALQRHVRLTTDIATRLPAVRGDPVHLEQVLLNLIMNAMDAMPAREDGEHSVDISASLRTDRMVEVVVCDSGPGIPPDRLDGIFEPFVTTRPGGMGMGLPICRNIIGAHGGRIWASNIVSGGAAFHFTLPALMEPGTR